MPTTLYIDADACPVKDEAVRVAERHGLVIHFVSNAYMRLPEGPLIKRVVVSDGPDAADDWIAERAGKGDIVVTADIPLAARCLEGRRARDRQHRQAVHRGRHRHGARHARSLPPPARDGREQGLQCRLHPPDRSRFLQALEEAVQAIKRGG